MPLPNAILIGAQKAGTSSLYDWIAQHPDVCGNVSVKDFPFFINNKFYQKGLNHLSEIFDSYYNNEKVILHGNVQYIFDPIGLKRIKKDINNPKFILILRNPVDRILSAYYYFKKMHLEDENNILIASIKKRKDRENSEDFVIRDALTYIKHGLYAKQLKEFLKHFNRDQLHICFFKDLKENKEMVMREVYNFLEINEDFIPEFDIKNKTGEIRSTFIQSLFFKKNIVRKFIVDKLVNKILPLHKRTELRWKIKELNTSNLKKEKQELSLEDRGKLLEYFIDDINKLERMLKIDLGFWKK